MLELRDVTAGYDTTTVLRDISLTVPDGKVIALIGPNGAGKTTTLRIASRLLAASSGEVALDGQDVKRWSPEKLARAGVCHVPEGHGIFPSLTVRENLATFAGPRVANQIVERASAEFPVLGQRLNQIAGTLSGGEQQMLALSRTFVGEPKVILLDEVSLGLAPRIVDDLFTFLGKLAQSGAALLLVEQYVERALAMADHVYLLNRGRIVGEGPPESFDAARIQESYVGVKTAL
jgi:branched-chain amino acid transport system ATP-binding protein